MRTVLVLEPGRTRDRAESALLRILWPSLQTWARRVAGSNQDDQDDLTQLMAERVVVMIRCELARAVPSQVDDWGRYFNAAAHHAVGGFLKDRLLVSGTGGQMARLSRLSKWRRSLTERTGFQPSAVELLTAHNDDMRARRSNAAKQGVLATLAEAEHILAT